MVLPPLMLWLRSCIRLPCVCHLFSEAFQDCHAYGNMICSLTCLAIIVFGIPSIIFFSLLLLDDFQSYDDTPHEVYLFSVFQNVNISPHIFGLISFVQRRDVLHHSFTSNFVNVLVFVLDGVTFNIGKCGRAVYW